MTTRDLTDALAFGDALVRAFGPSRARSRVALAPLTTFKVGGPADWLLELHGHRELYVALDLAAAAGVPVTVLGGGSNVLIGDAGVRGLVVRVRGGRVTSPTPAVARADAGVTLNGLVRWTITRGLAGLEMWAGTPGTVGGAVYGNAHFQGRLIGDRLVRAAVVSRGGMMAELEQVEMAFAYDDSRLRHTGEILLWADFAVARGEPARLRDIARAALRYRKHTQPLARPSAGCIFKNPDPERVSLSPDVPPSAGALIDRAGMKGATSGGALVSPTHANFIVNAGGATARDVRQLIGRCKRAVRERFGIELEEEIVYLGDWDE